MKKEDMYAYFVTAKAEYIIGAKYTFFLTTKSL